MKSNFKSSFVLLWVVLTLAATACAAPDNPYAEGSATASAASISPTGTAARTSTPTKTLTPTSAPVRPTATAQPTSTPEPAAAYTAEVIILVNKERAANGLPALAVNPVLMDNAQRWSVFMAENDVFYHSDYTVGENVGAGYLTPEEVVAGWMDSSGHRANILHPAFTQVGAGYAYADDSTYRHYWTLQFSP
jgi:uncharacterized protein YkwD